MKSKKKPVIRCKNENCLLNNNKKCDSPCRGREDWSCLGMNKVTVPTKEVLELKKQLQRESWRVTVSARGYEG